MEKYTVSTKSCLLQFKKSRFVLFNAPVEFMDCSLFLKNLEKHFCNLTSIKNFVKHIEIYRNIYPKNLSAIIIRLPISV